MRCFLCVIFVHYRLGSSSADRVILRDGIEIFIQQHISIAGLTAVAQTAAASGTGRSAVTLKSSDIQLRLKAARRALATVHAEDEGDVFGRTVG